MLQSNPLLGHVFRTWRMSRYVAQLFNPAICTVASQKPNLLLGPNRDASRVINLHAVEGVDCMEIDDAGRVTIWTKQKVWFLTRDGADGRIEKLRYVPRHPPSPKHVA